MRLTVHRVHVCAGCAQRARLGDEEKREVEVIHEQVGDGGAHVLYRNRMVCQT